MNKQPNQGKTRIFGNKILIQEQVKEDIEGVWKKNRAHVRVHQWKSVAKADVNW